LADRSGKCGSSEA